jgi:hypothetical protein
MGLYGDPAGVRSLATELQNVSSDVSATVPHLTRQVSGIVPASWSGAAADAFSTHWSNESFAMNELGITSGSLATVLFDLATALDAANQQAVAAATAAGFAGGPTPGDPAMQQADQMAQQAWTRATMQLAGQTVPTVGPATTPQQAVVWATGIVTVAPPPPPWYQTAGQTVQSWWDDAAQWVGAHHTDLLNLLGDTGWMTLGALGMFASGGLEAGGLLLDATGVGVIPGVAINWAGAAVFTASFAAGALGATKASHDLTHLFSTSNGPGSAPGSPGPPWNPDDPNPVLGQTQVDSSPNAGKGEFQNFNTKQVGKGALTPNEIQVGKDLQRVLPEEVSGRTQTGSGPQPDLTIGAEPADIKQIQTNNLDNIRSTIEYYRSAQGAHTIVIAPVAGTPAATLTEADARTVADYVLRNPNNLDQRIIFRMPDGTVLDMTRVGNTVQTIRYAPGP